MHLRFSRTACTDPNFSKDPPHACDQGNPLAKDLLIAPYDYGMAFEYPSTLEMWSWNFSVHNNHNNCDPADLDWRDEWSCNSGAKFWVGDVHDLGGLYVSANDAIDGAGNIISTSPNTFVTMAADTFKHQSHGSLFFQVRNTSSGGDSFVFQFGPWKHERWEELIALERDTSMAGRRSEAPTSPKTYRLFQRTPSTNPEM